MPCFVSYSFTVTVLQMPLISSQVLLLFFGRSYTPLFFCGQQHTCRRCNRLGHFANECTHTALIVMIWHMCPAIALKTPAAAFAKRQPMRHVFAISLGISLLPRMTMRNRRFKMMGRTPLSHILSLSILRKSSPPLGTTRT